MAYLDATTFSALLKTVYTQEDVVRATYEGNPFLGLLRKNTGMGAGAYKVPIIYANSQNRSASFTNASSVNTYTQSKAFEITNGTNYSFGQVSNVAIKGSKTDPMAFMRALKTEMDSCINALTDSLCTQLWGDGSGTIGQVSSSQTLSSTTLTLAKPESVVNFEYGMSVAFSATAGGAAKSGTAYVVKVDRTNGQLQLSATVGGTATALNTLVPTIAASDYIYANAGDAGVALKGVQAWLVNPSTLSGSDSFFGVNRNADPTRLGGVYLDGSTSSIEDVLIRAMTLTAREGGRPDYLFVNSNGLSQFMYSYQSRAQYVNVKPPEGPTLGYDAMFVAAPGLGGVKIVMDRRVPDGEAYLLQMDTWELLSIGDHIEMFDTDGLVTLRASDSDSVVFRANSYAQVGCHAPGKNARIILPT